MNKPRLYSVNLYYTTFQTMQIYANSEEEAVLAARERDVFEDDQLLSNLESWDEADEADAVKD